jgi:hypothetical protein
MVRGCHVRAGPGRAVHGCRGLGAPVAKRRRLVGVVGCACRCVRGGRGNPSDSSADRVALGMSVYPQHNPRARDCPFWEGFLKPRVGGWPRGPAWATYVQDEETEAG